MTGTSLTQFVATPALWPTPQARDGKGVDRTEIDRGNARPLNEVVAHWPTRAVTDAKGARNRTSGRSDPNCKHHDGVTRNDAIVLYSLPVPATSPVGGTPSHERRTLNPLFVEWLMGWPPGWTLLAWTDFACSATELCRWKRRMRSALSQLASPEEAPAQLSLLA